ncbi:MAG: hypothetical protein KF819_17425 [Labilithrix sp.]|nr:hypothetical protein [Labilithrix sp.]
MRRSRWAMISSASFAVIACAVGCGGNFSGDPSLEVALPDRDQFINGGVNGMMERKCGGLDCHGQVGRPLRIYSANGLRLTRNPDSPRPTTATTDAEKIANYYSVVGLEPEILGYARVEGVNAHFPVMQLLKKPLDISGQGVRHKGGPVLRQTDKAFNCLVTWIEGQVKSDDCND